MSRKEYYHVQKYRGQRFSRTNHVSCTLSSICMKVWFRTSRSHTGLCTVKPTYLGYLLVFTCQRGITGRNTDYLPADADASPLSDACRLSLVARFLLLATTLGTRVGAISPLCTPTRTPLESEKPRLLPPSTLFSPILVIDTSNDLTKERNIHHERFRVSRRLLDVGHPGSSS